MNLIFVTLSDVFTHFAVFTGLFTAVFALIELTAGTSVISLMAYLGLIITFLSFVALSIGSELMAEIS